MPKTPWKPPMWLFALDAIGLLLLGLGLVMQFAPDSEVAQSFPASYRLPMLTVGGGLLAFCWAGLAMSLLDHRRG
jgi:hypothetical protein